MTNAKPPVAPTSNKNYLFFVAAILFFLTAGVQGFSAYRTHLHPIPGDPGMFWIMTALNACLGTLFLIRGLRAR